MSILSRKYVPCQEIHQYHTSGLELKPENNEISLALPEEKQINQLSKENRTSSLKSHAKVCQEEEIWVVNVS